MQVELQEAASQTIRWRRRQLVAAGFSRQLATQIAHDQRYDLHALIELTEDGCPPQLAVRILAPLAEGSAA